MEWLNRLLGIRAAKRVLPSVPTPPRIISLRERTGPGHYRHDAVGTTYHQDAVERAWTKLGPPDGRDIDCDAELRLEPDNPHDPNAVAVLMADEHVAYLGRDEAARFAAQARDLAPDVSRFACRGRLTEWTGGGRYDAVVYFGFPLADDDT